MFDVLHCLVQLAQPRQGCSKRGVGLGHRHSGLRPVLRSDGQLFGHLQRSLGPLDCLLVVSDSKGEPSHLLIELRQLVVLRLIVEQGQARPVLGEGTVTIAGVPVQGADLAVEASLQRAIPRLLRQRHHLAEASQGDLLVTEAAHHIAQPLAGRHPLRSAAVDTARLERFQRALVMASRVLVGVEVACPVAGGNQVPRCLVLVGAQTEVMPERLEILEPLGLAIQHVLQRLGNMAMEGGATTQEHALIGNLLHECMREPVAGLRAGGRAG